MNDAHLPAAVLDALHNLTMAYRAHMRDALQAQALDLTPNELRVLLFVGQHPLCTHKDVVQHTGWDKAQVARVLQQMENVAWLQRMPHAQDRRSRCLQLGQRGAQVFGALRDHHEQLGMQMLRGSDPEQQQQLLALLQHMQGNLATLPAPQSPAEAPCPACAPCDSL